MKLCTQNTIAPLAFPLLPMVKYHLLYVLVRWSSARDDSGPCVAERASTNI